MSSTAAASAQPWTRLRLRWTRARARRARAAERALARSSFLALAVLAVVGATVFDDYGVSPDEELQRRLGQAAIDAVVGDVDALRLFDPPHHRFYGAALEAPLALVERLPGLEDSRTVLLTRHLLTHLFFLAGALAASLLAYRLCRSRWLALFALLVFVLHPRVYAHSFFNSKDVPFLAMFMIALYLVHRAFRQDRLGAFAACGAAVGVLTNLRIMGLLLFAAVLALRALDLVQADGWAARRRVLASAGVFVLASALTLYAVSPILWPDPFALIEAFATLSQHPTHASALFQGERIRWPEIPAHYLPTWIAITTPPVVLVLGLAGAAAVVHRALARPGEALRNTDTRFGLLLAACPALTVAAVIVLNANVYGGWRQTYFLHAPLTGLAVFGLHRLLRPLRARPALHAGAGVLAAAGVAATVVEMVLIHPHQAVYFNLLVDRRTPEHLRTRYDMEYWGTAHREGLEYLLGRHPSSTIPLRGYDSPPSSWLMLTDEDRRRILFSYQAPQAAGFFITGDQHTLRRKTFAPPFAPVVYTRKVYDNTILTVTALDPALVDEATAEAYREIHRSMTRRTPVVRSDFDLHLDANTLIWVKESCRPADLDRSHFFLGVVPEDVDDLPRRRRERGFENLPFDFPELGVYIDGACMMRRPLPSYPVRRIETGERSERYDLWRAAIALSPRGEVAAAADVYREAYRSARSVAPAARSYFDLHLDGGALTWIRESCSPEDTRGRFFVHLIPEDPSVLPAERRADGYEALGFEFRRGPWRFPRIAGRFDGRCVVSVALPEYPLAGLRTGQAADGGRVWEVALTLPGDPLPGPGPTEPGRARPRPRRSRAPSTAAGPRRSREPAPARAGGTPAYPDEHRRGPAEIAWARPCPGRRDAGVPG